MAWTKFVYEVKKGDGYISIARYLMKNSDRSYIQDLEKTNYKIVKELGDAIQRDLGKSGIIKITPGDKITLVKEIGYYIPRLAAKKISTTSQTKTVKSERTEKTEKNDNKTKATVVKTKKVKGKKGIVIDPGTIYPTDSKKPTVTEKEVVRKLGKLFSDKLSNYSVYSTRSLTADEAVSDHDKDKKTGYKTNWGKTAQKESLQDRVAFANNMNPKPDLFISIHVNYSSNAKEKGMSCYIDSSSSGKKSDTYLKLIKKFAGAKKIPFSSQGFRHVKDFYVVKYTKGVPAVLLEICNINNDDDRKNISSNTYLTKIASALKEAVDEFFK